MRNKIQQRMIMQISKMVKINNIKKGILMNNNKMKQKINRKMSEIF